MTMLIKSYRPDLAPREKSCSTWSPCRFSDTAQQSTILWFLNQYCLLWEQLKLPSTPPRLLPRCWCCSIYFEHEIGLLNCLRVSGYDGRISYLRLHLCIQQYSPPLLSEKQIERGTMEQEGQTTRDHLLPLHFYYSLLCLLLLLRQFAFSSPSCLQL